MAQLAAQLAHLRRRGPGSLYRRYASMRFLATRDRRAAIDFLGDNDLGLGLVERAAMLRRFVRITNEVRGYHTLTEMLTVSRAILHRRQARPVVVEAGCGYGSSTAKLSVATRAAGGSMWVFDSFRGLPDNDESHQNLDGRTVVFRRGAFRATLPSVMRTLEAYGEPNVCRVEKGWFDDTLQTAPPSIDVILLDVDLLASTRTCLRALFPRLAPGGILFSQDGHLRATHELCADEAFWRHEVGVAPPIIYGLGSAKLLAIEPRDHGQRSFHQ